MKVVRPASLVAACILLTSCGPEVSDQTRKPAVRPVKLITIEGTSSLESSRYPAVVNASQISELSFPVGGRLNEFPVIESQQVEEGYVIARLDQRDFASKVDAANAQFANAQDEYQSAVRLSQTDAIARNVLEQRRTQRDVAKSQLESAEKALEDATLTAPFPGVIAMLSEHPYSLEYKIIKGKPRKNITNWGPMFFVIECNPHGCFPLRGTNGSLYFPDDGITRRFFVTGWELIAAIDTKTVSEIKFLEYYDFEKTQDFSDYVNHFWTERQRFKSIKDKGGEFYCKIFLNSLYGKFGMDIRKHKNYTLRPRSDMAELMLELEDGESIQEFKEWCILVEEAATGRKRFYNLATAASITGFVRAMLWRAVCDAERPVYCDTDSITAVSFGKDVVLSEKLGDWDVEYNYDRVAVCGKKLYAMHIKGKSLSNKDSWKIASKGAKLTHTEIIKIAGGEKVLYNNPVPTFSVSKVKPTFVHREIRATASDIRTVPRRYDPTFKDDDETEDI